MVRAAAEGGGAAAMQEVQVACVAHVVGRVAAFQAVAEWVEAATEAEAWVWEERVAEGVAVVEMVEAAMEEAL